MPDSMETTCATLASPDALSQPAPTTADISQGGTMTPQKQRQEAGSGIVSFDTAATTFAELRCAEQGFEVDSHSIPTMDSLGNVPKLLDIFHMASFQKLFHALENDGAAANMSSDDLDWIRTQPGPLTQTALDETTSDNLAKFAYYSEQRDRVMKDELLKIYANTAKAVHLANALDNWKCCKFEVQQVAGFIVDLSLLHFPQELSVSLVTWEMEWTTPSWTSPKVTITLPSGNICHNAACMMGRLECNAILERDDQLHISVFARSVDDEIILVGTVSAMASILCETAMSSRQEAIELDLVPTPASCLQPGNKVKILLQTASELVTSRRDEVQKYVKVSIDSIQQFNDTFLDTGRVLGLPALSDVKVAGGSLTKAASITGISHSFGVNLAAKSTICSRACTSPGTTKELVPEYSPDHVARQETIPCLRSFDAQNGAFDFVESPHLDETTADNVTKLAFQSQQRDQVLKNELLNMYSNAAVAVRLATDLDKWQSCNLELQRIAGMTVDLSLLYFPPVISMPFVTTEEEPISRQTTK